MVGTAFRYELVSAFATRRGVRFMCVKGRAFSAWTSADGGFSGSELWSTAKAIVRPETAIGA